jgi:hypothetical protein
VKSSEEFAQELLAVHRPAGGEASKPRGKKRKQDEITLDPQEVDDWLKMFGAGEDDSPPETGGKRK